MSEEQPKEIFLEGTIEPEKPKMCTYPVEVKGEGLEEIHLEGTIENSEPENKNVCTYVV